MSPDTDRRRRRARRLAVDRGTIFCYFRAQYFCHKREIPLGLVPLPFSARRARMGLPLRGLRRPKHTYRLDLSSLGHGKGQEPATRFSSTGSQHQVALRRGPFRFSSI